jgi:hypothetical protein
MKSQILLLILALTVTVCALILTTTSSRDEYFRQTVDQSQYQLQGIEQNPWKQFASTFNIMQLPNDCQKILDLYSKEPTEENYAKLLNCNMRPEEYSKIKAIAATFAGPK